MSMAKLNQYRISVPIFLQETRRLGPAVVGSYIRLLLDYFEQGKAPPDDDAVLARIVGADPSFWAEIRPRIEHLFEISAAGWVHAHTEEQIEAAAKRMKKSAKAAAVAAVVTGKPMPPMPPMLIPTKTVTREELAKEYPKAPAAMTDEQVDRMIHEQEDEDDEEEIEEIEPPVTPPVGIVFEGPIPKDFRPTAAVIAERMAEGYSSQQIADVIDQFRRYHQISGTTSVNWPELEERWWKRKKTPLHPAEKKPKPRVEVSRRAPPPTE